MRLYQSLDAIQWQPLPVEGATDGLRSPIVTLDGVFFSGSTSGSPLVYYRGTPATP